MRFWFLAGILFALSMTTSNAQQQPRVTGFFTDMHFAGEGDLIGTEVWIVYARDKFWATVLSAEGEPDPPVVVPVEVSGSRVKFTVKQPPITTPTISIPAVTTHYSGVVSKAGLMLSIGGTPPHLLKRQNWQ